MNTITITTMIAVLLLVTAAPGAAAPKLTVDHDSFDFGFVPQNAKVSHSFWLKAEGDDSLKILKVVTGCGCTKAPLERSLLAVGDSTRLEIIFSTGKRQGKNTKSPQIQTNEGKPYQRVKISTEIVTRPDSTYPIVIDPYKLIVGQFSDKKSDRRTFSITNIAAEPVTLRLVDEPSELLAVDLPVTIEPGKTAEGVMRLTERGLDKSFEKSFTIELGDENHSRFTVPVKHSVRPSVNAASK